MKLKHINSNIPPVYKMYIAFKKELREKYGKRIVKSKLTEDEKTMLNGLKEAVKLENG